MSINLRYIFHIAGIIIVLLWISLLIYLHKSNYTERPPTNILSAESSWFEIFFKGRKIGYLTERVIPTERGYTITENLAIKVSFLGYPEDVNVRIRYNADKDFLLRDFDLSFIADRLRFHIWGTVKENQLIINRVSGFKRKIYLPNPPVAGMGIFPFVRFKKIAVGDVFFIPFLDPISMNQCRIKVKVADKVKIRIKNSCYEAYKLETEIWGNPVTAWVDLDGRILKQEGFMGLVIIRSNPQDAISNIPASELYDIVSIKADKKIPDPRNLSYLKVKITGGGYKGKVFEIKKVVISKTSFYKIPYRKKDLSIYLRPELNIECNDELIVKKAKEIAGKETNPVKIVRKVVDWVYKNIEKKPVISFPSALETLKSRVGDCNEHAVLVAALLRAVGIPARICVGLLYNNGYFFYHAWNEAYVGRWIPIDATLNQVPVDATHILLFYGNIEKQVQLTRMLGNLNIEILDFSHDKINKSNKKI